MSRRSRDERTVGESSIWASLCKPRSAASILVVLASVLAMHGLQGPHAMSAMAEASPGRFAQETVSGIAHHGGDHRHLLRTDVVASVCEFALIAPGCRALVHSPAHQTAAIARKVPADRFDLAPEPPVPRVRLL